jgi:HlyD family secretion protein
MRLSKRVWVLSIATLVLAGAAWGVGSSGPEGQAVVRRGDVVRTVVAPGVVESETDEVSLGFDTSGRIAAVLVDEGETVAPGQLLARLDDRIALAKLAQAEAELAAAEARRDAAYRGARRGELEAAEADVASLRAQAADRERTRSRTEALQGSGAVSAAAIDGARDASAAANAALAAADARLGVLRSGARGEARREASAAMAAAEALVEEARAYVSYFELRSPIAGVVVRRLGEPGEQVSSMPPTVVLTVADMRRLRLRTEIDEADVGRVSVGDGGYATADAFSGRRFPGKVVRVGRALGRKHVQTEDPRQRVDTRVLDVLFQLDDSSGLPLGLRMQVHVAAEARRGVLTIPLAAVDRGKVTVFADGDESQRAVRLGLDDGVLAEVSAGLREGETVAVPSD